MGNCTCCAAEEYVEPPRQKKNFKVLFLGSGGCGKSTLFKQLKKIYGLGISMKDKKDATHGISQFVIVTMQTLLDDQELIIDELSDNAQISADYVYQIDSKPILNDEIANHIRTLWSEDSIKTIFDRTAKLHLNGPCAYFFDSIDRISKSDYEPTFKDILMQRRPTTGLIEAQIIFSSNDDDDKDDDDKDDDDKDDNERKFLLVDVGGQKNERIKWIHQFERVSAVVYVISLAAYDEPLYENENINSLHDSLDLFKQTVNDHWFYDKPFFLLFNKKDVFEQKIVNKSLADCMNEHNDINDYDNDKYYYNLNDDDAKINKNIEFIQDVYLRQIKRMQDDEEIPAYVTCAFDENQVEDVFSEILPAIIGEKRIKLKRKKSNIVKIDIDTNEKLGKIDIDTNEKLGKIDIDTNEKLRNELEYLDISWKEKILRVIGKVVYYIVMLIYVLHIILLFPFLKIFYKLKNIEKNDWKFKTIPIEDTFYGFSILITMVIVTLCIFLFDAYVDIESLIISYITWSLYVVIYLFNRAYTIYVIFSENSICGIKAKNVKTSNIIIKYIIGVEIKENSYLENSYIRPLAVIAGLFPCLIVGFITNYILKETYHLECSPDVVSNICSDNICCKMISSHQLENFYDIIASFTSRLLASFGIVRIIGWLFCNGHPELRDITKKMK